MNKINLIFSKIRPVEVKKEGRRFSLVTILVLFIFAAGIYLAFKVVGITDLSSISIFSDYSKKGDLFFETRLNERIKKERASLGDKDKGMIEKNGVQREEIVQKSGLSKESIEEDDNVIQKGYREERIKAMPEKEILEQKKANVLPKIKNKQVYNAGEKSSGSNFKVVVSSCFYEWSAKNIENDLIRHGFSPERVLTDGEINIYRVTVGELVDRSVLEKIQSDLKNNGIKSRINLLENENFRLETEAMVKEQTSLKAVNIIKGFGYVGNVLSNREKVPLFQISVGFFETRKEAEKAKKQLDQAGFSPFIKRIIS